MRLAFPCGRRRGSDLERGTSGWGHWRRLLRKHVTSAYAPTPSVGATAWVHLAPSKSRPVLAGRVSPATVSLRFLQRPRPGGAEVSGPRPRLGLRRVHGRFYHSYGFSRHYTSFGHYTDFRRDYDRRDYDRHDYDRRDCDRPDYDFRRNGEYGN
jgi:hypothetical protein